MFPRPLVCDKTEQQPTLPKFSTNLFIIQGNQLQVNDIHQMLFQHKKAVSYSIDTDLHHHKSTAYRAETARALMNDCSLPSEKFLTMNDERKKIVRNYSRDFVRSETESELFTNRVKRVKLDKQEKPDRSLNRKYKNQSHLGGLGAATANALEEELPKKGVKKVTITPKQEKACNKKHYEQPKQQATSDQVFIVDRVNLCDQHTNKIEPKIMINLGKKRMFTGYANSSNLSSLSSKEQSPAAGCITQRRHFTKSNAETKIKKILGTSHQNEEINFKLEYFKRNQRIPDSEKYNCSKNSFSKFQSRITHHSGPAQRLMQRFRNY